LCCARRVGKSKFDAKVLVYETMAIKAVYHNIETRTNLRKSNVEKMISIRGRSSVVCWASKLNSVLGNDIHELGIIPILRLLTYQKPMLYHNLINLDDDRLGKMAVLAQEESGLINVGMMK